MASQVRPFTDAELEFLTEWFDTTNVFNTPFPVTNETLKVLWKSVARRQARMQRVPIDFPQRRLVKFKEWMKNTFIKNLTPYGHPVGKEAGTSIGEHTSQITLKLKGNTGTSASSKVQNMSQVFQKFLKASKTSIEIIDIRFVRDWKFRDLYFNRLLFYPVNIKNAKFIKKIEYINQEEIETPDWYDMYSSIYDIEIPYDKKFMRVTCNTSSLYSYRVTLQDIADKLTESAVGEYITIFLSPQHIGIIDIFPADNYTADLSAFQRLLLGQDVVITEEKPKAKKGKKVEVEEEEDDEDDEDDEGVNDGRNIFEDEEESDTEEEPRYATTEEVEAIAEKNAQDIFLKTKVRPILDSLKFGNDNDTISLSVNWDNYLIIIKKESVIGERKYNIVYNTKIIKEKSIKVENFVSFFTNRGWSFEETSKGCILQHDSSDTTPTQLLRDATSNIIDFDDAVQPYIQIEGYMDDAVILPGIDITTIRTDGIVSVKKYFGIESARKSLLEHVKDIFASDVANSIFLAHLILLADFMTVTGEVLSLDRHGVGKGNGPMAKSTFEQQKDAFVSGAARPVKEPDSVPGSVFLGTVAEVGTGVIRTLPDESFKPPVQQADLSSKEIDLLKLLLKNTDLEIAETTVTDAVNTTISPEIDSSMALTAKRLEEKQRPHRKPIIKSLKLMRGEISQNPKTIPNLAPNVIQVALFESLNLEDDNPVEFRPPPVKETPVVKVASSADQEPATKAPTIKKVVRKIVTKKTG